MSQSNVTAAVTNPLVSSGRHKTRRKGKFNALKRRALAVFENRGWLDVPTWARLAGVYPIRAAYTYLLRLHRYGLLLRRTDARLRVVYRLSTQGRRRLAWLQS